jgi:uncharacterized protein (DUF433 family)
MEVSWITTNPTVRNGRPCLAGTTVEVSVIAVATIVHGQSAEEIAADYDLSLPQVYAALAYYYDHKAEIDATIQDRRQWAQTMKEQRVGSRHPSLSG